MNIRYLDPRLRALEAVRIKRRRISQMLEQQVSVKNDRGVQSLDCSLSCSLSFSFSLSFSLSLSLAGSLSLSLSRSRSRSLSLSPSLLWNAGKSCHIKVSHGSPEGSKYPNGQPFGPMCPKCPHRGATVLYAVYMCL